jgi:glycosyltransferase involved in cell wall biosynthesis
VFSINDWWKESQGDRKVYSSEFTEIFDRVEYHHLTEKRVSPILQELFFKRKIKKALKEKEFDVHLNYNSLISGYEASKKVKSVFDIADNLVAMIRQSTQIPNPFKSLGSYLGKIFLNKNIAKAKKVTLTTEVLKEEFNISTDKVEIIPNGVDTQLFRNRNNSKEDFKVNEFIIGYVGVLREWVYLKDVFRALNELKKEIRMVIVGREGKFQENFELAKKCGVADRVTFTGMIPYSEVPKQISRMDVCLIPFDLNLISKSALPLKLFEYMACEKPVISQEIPGVKTVAGDKILYASNEREYVNKILMLYEDRALRIKLGREGRRIVEGNYDWKKIVERLESVLYTIREAA